MSAFVLVTAMVLLVGAAPSALADPNQDLSVTGYQYVGGGRVDRDRYEYTYTITVTNAGGAYQNVVATAGSKSPNTLIVDGAVNIGDLGAGASVQSTDSFTFSQHREYLFDPASIVWSFAADPVVDNTPPVADAGPDQVIAFGNIVTLNGSGSSDADGDPISFSWSLVGVPPGSSAVLDDPASVTPTFFADLPGAYVAGLVVNDGQDASAPDTVTITTENTPPVADAGNDQTVAVGETVFLSGAGSFDANGDTLTYLWSLIGAPPGSAASLGSTTQVDTTFVADAAGSYAVELIVNDGLIDSAPDTVAIDTSNTAPVADAGPDQDAQVGDSVPLDGSGSFDADGDELTYLWSLITAPAGSAASVADPAAEMTSFVPDVAGLYVAQLIVSDGLLDSDPDTSLITIAVGNQAPTAVATADPTSVTPGETVQLDGAQSSDPDGDALTYSWSLTVPSGSTSTLSSATAESPTFSADVEGTFVATLVVNDGDLDSAPASVSVSAAVANNPPSLVTIGNRVMFLGETLSFRIFAIDPDPGDVLTLSLPVQPVGIGFNAGTGAVSFTPTPEQLGVNSVTARVDDAGGLFDTQSFTIEVRDAVPAPPENSPPRLDPIADQTIVIGNSLGLQANATDADVGDTLTYSLPAAPPGMTINGTGMIEFTPAEAQIGAHDVTVRVTDSAGSAAFESFIVTVISINRPPIAVDEVYPARIGETTSEPAPGVLGNDSDPDNDPITATLVTDVSNGVLDLRSDGSFDYTPGLPDETGPVDLEIRCETSLANGERTATNGTIAAGDVDNDGNVELVGQTFFSQTIRAEPWIIDATTCEPELEGSSDVVEAGGVSDGAHPGLLDIDGDGDLEIINVRNRTPVVDSTGGFFDFIHLIAYHHDGTLAWPGDGGSETLSSLPAPTVVFSPSDYRYKGPTFADLDADGTVEIVMTFVVPISFGVNAGIVAYDSSDGTILWEYVSDFRQGGDTDAKPPVIVDLDLDGTMEVIFHNSVVDHTGNLEFLLPSQESVGTLAASHLTVAVANFDGDAFPEIIARDGSFHYLFEHDGTIKWRLDEPNTAQAQITVADFDDDGQVEFAYVSSFSNVTGTLPGHLSVWDTDGTMIWTHENNPEYQVSSVIRATGPNATAFDANEDGAADLVINLDQGPGPTSGLYIFDGRDGSQLAFGQTDNFNASEQDFVTIVDVDDDGEAEMITSYTGGLAGRTIVWGGSVENPMPPAPAVRNQWMFNQAHIEFDGSIISNPTPAWLQPGRNGYHLVSAPDRIYTQKQCESPNDYRSAATVAAGDVDNDGRGELVGAWYVSSSLLVEPWIIDAETCVPEPFDPAPVLAAGGFTVGQHIGLLDIDGDSDLEIIGVRGSIIGVGSDGEHLIALHHDGSLAWPGDGVSEDLGVDSIGNSTAGGFNQQGPVFADIDANGTVDIVMPWTTGAPAPGNGVTVFNAADGTILWEYQGTIIAPDSDYKAPTVVDLDLDGTMEIIYHTEVLDHLGNREFVLPVDDMPIFGETHLTVAVANFDAEPYPEIIARDQNFHYLYEHDGSVIFQQEAPNRSQGQITVADFDGDNEVEFAYHTGLGIGVPGYMAVYETDGSLLWNHEDRQDLHEPVSGLGGNTTAFDANNDGAYDVVVQYTFGSEALYVFDGRDGSVLERVKTTGSPTEQRFNTIVDVDGDGEAEFVTSGGLTTLVYEGTASHPLPRAPAQRNQWIFNEGIVDADGDIVTNPVPHWLQPGLNGWNLLRRPPDPLAGTTDSFTYVANDGEFDSNVATVTFDVQPAGNPPVFLSQPDTLTTVGFPYAYDPFVVDVDPGDAISFTLAAAPPGMTMTVNGTLNWLPDAEGAYAVSLVASDTIGFSTVQSFTLQVGQPVTVPDVVGLPQAGAETTLAGANLLTGTVQTANDPTIPAGSVISQLPIAGAVIEFGGEVDLIVSLGPAPEDIDDDNDGFTENQGDCNDAADTVFPGAPDAEGDGVDADCDGIDGNLVLTEIRVSPATATVLTNEVVNLTAIGIFEDGTSQNLTGVVDWSVGPAFSSSTPGSFVVTASRAAPAVKGAPYRRGDSPIRGFAGATVRGGGIVGSATIDVIERAAGDAIPPVVEITAPGNNATVTAPTDITGSASDANFLRYELAYALAGDTDFTVIATSTSPVADGVLGQFDPTLLINDLYTIRLTVFDTGGNQSIASTTVQVDENLKVGNFSLEFTDLAIPMSGLDIRVKRVYDSRDKARGDFGVGWRLDVQSIRLRTNRPLGSGWEVIQSGLAFGLLPNDEHKVSITLPNGRVEEFDLVVSPTSSALVPFPPSVLNATFRARPGSLGRLESLDNNILTILDPQPGDVTLLNDVTIQTYNPDLYRYTDSTGTQYVISRENGVQSVRDLAGNTLTFSPSGIAHSDGKSISFIRDDLGRIIELTDPRGNSQTYDYDGNGDLRAHTDAESNTARYKYNADHGLVEYEDAAGNVPIRYEYDDDGRLTAIVDAFGNRTEYTRDIEGREEIETDRRGNVVRHIYDDRGNVLSSERTVTIDGVPTVAIKLVEYDDRSNETAIVDADGIRTEYTYDDRDNVTAATVDPDGLNLETTYVYDDDDNLIQTIDPTGGVSINTFDSQRKPLTVADTGGNATSFFYDDGGRLVATEDAVGTVTTRTLSAFGQVLAEEIVDSDGNLVSRTGFAYDQNGNRTERTEFVNDGATLVGLTTTFTYDANNRLLTTTDPEGNITRSEYDEAGRLSAQFDGNNNRTGFLYNARGELVETQFADGTSILRDYDTGGNLVSVVDEAGRPTTFDYDELERQVATNYADGATEREVLSAGGLLVGRVDGNGNRTEFVYDTAGRQTQTILATTGPQAATIDTTFDNAGRILTSRDPNGHVTNYSYDLAGRQTGVLYEDGSSISRTYDAAGRVTSETDELDRTTQREYDGAGRLVTVIQPSPDGAMPNPVTRYQYDLRGNLLSQTDALGRVTRFEFDGAGRRVAVVLPSGQVAGAAFDGAGNVVSRTDFNGDTTVLGYDLRNRLVSAEYGDGSSVSYTYTLTGARATAGDESGLVTYGYDARDRAVSVTDVDGIEVTYGYDLGGNQTSVAAPGYSTQYEYDARNRLRSVIDATGTTTYEYDLAGNLTGTARPNGVTTTTTVDTRNRVSLVEHRDVGDALLESFEYTHYANGQRQSITQSDGSVESYTYDDLGRLTGEVRTGSDSRVIGYVYDAVGNRVQRNDGGAVVDYSYGENGELLRAGTTTFGYDASGQRVSRDTGGTVTAYQWDDRGRLSRVSLGGVEVASYRYDAIGNRVGAESDLGVRRFLVDGESRTGFAQVLQERDAADSVLARYYYGDDLLSGIAGTERFHLTDALGSTRVLTDSGGAVSDSYDYGAFGTAIAETGASSNPYRYAGERLDAETGLYYLRARYYDAQTGTFLSRDPFAGDLNVPITLQPYPYAAADPVNNLDPSGEMTLADTTAAQAISNTAQRISTGVAACTAIERVQDLGTAVAATQFGIALGTALIDASSILSGGSALTSKSVTLFNWDKPGSRFVDKTTLSLSGPTPVLAYAIEGPENVTLSGTFNLKTGEASGAVGVSVPLVKFGVGCGSASLDFLTVSLGTALSPGSVDLIGKDAGKTKSGNLSFSLGLKGPEELEVGTSIPLFALKPGTTTPVIFDSIFGISADLLEF